MQEWNIPTGSVWEPPLQEGTRPPRGQAPRSWNSRTPGEPACAGRGAARHGVGHWGTRQGCAWTAHTNTRARHLSPPTPGWRPSRPGHSSGQCLTAWSQPLLTVKTHSRPSRLGEPAIPAAKSELPRGQPATNPSRNTDLLYGALTTPLTCKWSSQHLQGALSCQPETDPFTSWVSSPLPGSTIS